MFPCDKCGACCRNVYKVQQLKHLALASGICKHLDQETNLCKIYQQRPLHCNVDAYYEMFIKNIMSVEEFYAMNLECCKELKKSGVIAK